MSSKLSNAQMQVLRSMAAGAPLFARNGTRFKLDGRGVSRLTTMKLLRAGLIVCKSELGGLEMYKLTNAGRDAADPLAT